MHLQSRVQTFYDTFPSYMQSVPELCTTVCCNITFTHDDPVCRPTLCAASISSSSTMKIGADAISDAWSVLLTDKSLFHLGRSDRHGWDENGRLLGQHPNTPGTLGGELGEALPQVWQNIIRTFLPNLNSHMRRQNAACMHVKGGQTRYW